MVCTVKVQNRGQKDIGVEFANDTTADKTFGMPAGKNDHGEMVTVSGCGDDYAVYLYQHNPINRNRGQNAGVFQDGSWWLHHLRGDTSAAEITRVTKPDRAVGYQNIHFLSHYGVKNQTHQLFKSAYEIKPGVRVNHVDLCPGGGEVIPLSMHNEYGGVHDYTHRFACSYPKTESAIRLAENGTSGKPTRPMYEDMINRLCAKKENLGFGLPGGTICAERDANRNLAKNYCLEGENMVTNKTVCDKDKIGTATYTDILKTYCARGANIKSTLCSELSKDEKGTTSAYETLWRNYCDRTPGDSWCACYNAVKDAASGFCGSNPTAAGCVKVKQSFGKLVEKTPNDQKAVWNGMQPCFGGVCSASDTFKPDGYNASCDKSVNVCIQDFKVEGLRDSQINATCEINNTINNDGGGGGSQPSVNTPGSPPPASDPSAPPGSPPSSDSSAPAKDNTTMYVGIGIAVVVLVLILLMSGGGGGGGGGNYNYNNY